jgi:putative phosphoribosyl transferase
MGAIATGGIKFLNQEFVKRLKIPEVALEAVVSREKRELERREQAYRGDRPVPEIGNRRIILVDDGLATGATMRAAVLALRQQQPAKIIIGVPVAPLDTVEKLWKEADEVICLATPEPFFAIGEWYMDFSQTSDEEVRELLARAWMQAEKG